MPLLTIRHVTTYRYRQPVALGEYRMMLRPRDSQDQRVVEARLDIRPEPITLRFVEDAFGNHLAIAQFFGRAQELCFDSIVSLEHRPQDLTDYDLDDTCMCPATYSSSEYLSDIGAPPPYGPMDFAGWFEAYLGGRWYTFDPRNNTPRIGRVLIAQGRDAVDVPITLTFGPSTLVSFKVWTDEIN